MSFCGKIEGWSWGWIKAGVCPEKKVCCVFTLAAYNFLFGNGQNKQKQTMRRQPSHGLYVGLF